jgi:hypothetical protein
VEVVWQVKLFRVGTPDAEIQLQSDPSFTTSVNVPFHSRPTGRLS